MKQGKLVKQGKFWKIESADMKNPITVPGDFGLTDDMNGKDVTFDNTGGPVKAIIFEGKKYIKQQVVFIPERRQEGKGGNTSIGNSTPIGTAHAPYNFVPINEKIVKSPIDINAATFDKSNLDLLSGEISIEIEALTPLFIRGLKSLNLDKDEKTPEFYKGLTYSIPGSSLRGLLRSMIEIASYSKMGSVNQSTFTKRFNYRAFADKSLTLRDSYASKMLVHEQVPVDCYYPKVKAGVLIKEGLKYTICEGLHYKVEEDDAFLKGVISEKMSYLDTVSNRYKKNNRYNADIYKVYYTAGATATHAHSGKVLKYAKVTNISKSAFPSSLSGYLVCTGWMVGSGVGIRSRGKHMHWVIGNINYTKKIEIASDVIDNYNNDISRDGMNLIKKFEDRRIKEVPCFFITDSSNRIISFGQTGMFRLAYDKSLIEFFPEGHKMFKENDFTELLFGKIDVMPSRIFVEDCNLIKGTVSNEIKIPAIMGSPKPTTFQHYLKQDINSITSENNSRGQLSGFRGILDYNQSTVVNGHKLYWHQPSVDYPERIELGSRKFQSFLQSNHGLDNFRNFDFRRDKITFNIASLSPVQYNALTKYTLTKTESQHTSIKPILKNAIFKGIIRFEKLTKEELGSLLFFLHLPDNLCLKIGMGKALGFGSIRISAKTRISDRKLRYMDFQTGWGSSDTQKELEKHEIESIIKIFENYILSFVSPSHSVASLWELDRMKEFKTMLDISNSLSGKKASYMLIKDAVGENEYKLRPILLEPTKYIL